MNEKRGRSCIKTGRWAKNGKEKMRRRVREMKKNGKMGRGKDNNEKRREEKRSCFWKQFCSELLCERKKNIQQPLHSISSSLPQLSCFVLVIALNQTDDSVCPWFTFLVYLPLYTHTHTPFFGSLFFYLFTSACLNCFLPHTTASTCN